jgi:D-tyrosyl-tRNA(Tyr) deacylase
MRAVVQRVSRARVTVGEEITGEIGLGLLVLLGVGAGDTRSDADYLVEKIIGLRIFEDAGGKMNLSVAEVGGALLVVRSLLFTETCAAASVRRSMRLLLLSRRANSTNILWRRSASSVCAVKLDVSRKRCKWNSSTKDP